MEKRQNDLQEIMVVQKSVKWMVNLGIPLIVGILSYNAVTLDKLKDSDAAQQKDIAVLQEQVGALQSVFGRNINRKKVSYLNESFEKPLIIEAILPREEKVPKVKETKRDC